MGNIEVLANKESDRSRGHLAIIDAEVEDDIFVFPATPGQKRIWDMNIQEPNNPAANILLRFRLKGPVQTAILERALREIVRRHESLRTTFAVLDARLVQIVSQQVRFGLRYEDLRALPERERMEYALAKALQEASLCFDLRRGPLFRGLLVQCDDNDHILVLTAHPSVFDGQSLHILTSELGLIYGAYSQGLDSPLQELKLQYGDFTVWQEQRLGGNTLDKQRTYWPQRLKNLPIVELPPDRPRPAVRTHNSDIVSVLLPTEMTDEWAISSRRAGLTSFTLLLTAFKILIQRRTGRNDIVVGSVLAGRTQVELEPSIGPFENPVLLRTDLSGDPSFDEVAIRVRYTVLGAVANQDIPYELVMKSLRPKRDISESPIASVNFIYTRDLVDPFNVSGLSLTAMPVVSTGAVFDLNVLLVDGPDGCTAYCEFNTDLYHQASVLRLLTQYQTLLKGITKDSMRRISEYSLDSAIGNSFTEEPAFLSLSAPALGSIEARLVDMWKFILRIDQIHITDDFFDLGGHSLLATQMIAEIEEEFGRKIPFATFLQAPTIELLTALLRTSNTSKPFAIENAVRSGSSDRGRPTLFLVHDGDGDSLLYLNLARRLRNEVEVSCLEPLGSERCPCLHTRIPDMAAYYIEQMQSTRRKGPYFLGGLCAGGVIAFEMATQLRAKGEEIGFVALFDAVAPRAKQRMGIIAEQRRGRFFQSLRETANLTLWQRWKQRITIMGQKVLNLFVYEARTRTNRLISWVRYRIFQMALDRGRPVPVWAEGLPVRLIYDMAEQSYVPGGKYDVPVVLMRATTGEGDDEPLVNHYLDEMLGWPAYVAGKVDCIDVPGGHSSMLKEPHVAVLAEHLRAGIQEKLDV